MLSARSAAKPVPHRAPCSGVEDGDLRGVEAGRIGDGIDVRNHTPLDGDVQHQEGSPVQAHHDTDFAVEERGSRRLGATGEDGGNGPGAFDPCRDAVDCDGGWVRAEDDAGVDGTVEIADDITRSHIEISIDMATVDSGAANRDDSLRSQNFFDAANHPRATFRSTEITAHGSAGTITGVLTIKGITRSVTLDVEYLGHARDPWGNDRAAFRAATMVNREEWGLTVPTAVDAGGVLVSKDIRLEIETELFKG